MFKLEWKRLSLTLMLLAISSGVWAQSPQRVPRIGVVAPLSPPPSPSPDVDGFRRGLKELGYVEGQSIIVEYRWGLGRPDKAVQLAVELAKLDLDALVVAGPISAAAANRASSRTPVVFAASGVDPVSIGLVASLARPGGNITGLAMMATELAEKRLELMRDTVPGLSRIGVLIPPADPRAIDPLLKGTEAAARAAGIQTYPFRVQVADDLDKAFKTAARERVGAMIALQNPFFANENARIAMLALKHHIPTMSGEPSFAEAGGLMTYGPSIPDLWRRAAVYVDKILKGTSPAVLPIEQPTKFDLVINLKTAGLLGMNIPESVLMRADQIIR